MVRTSKATYTGITTLEGLMGVRTRLSMYIGSTGVLREGHMPRALAQMMQEVISNAADEYLAGYGDIIDVTINADGSATVLDHGRGMPKGPGASFDDVERAATQVHSSGKFADGEGGGYGQVTGVAGMNGVGIKAVNAGSSRFEIEARCAKTKKGKHGGNVAVGGNETYRIAFKQDEVVEKKVIEKDAPPGTYTKITFWPDGGPISDKNREPVLQSTEWVVKDLIPRLESTAFLMDGLTIRLTDERPGREFSQQWRYEHGIEDYLAQRLEGSEVMPGMKKPIVIREKTVLDGDEFELRAAFTWTEDMGSDIVSFANGVPTPEGGPHLDGFKSALGDAFRGFAESRKLSKKRLGDDDVLDGLAAVFEVRIPARLVDFEGQTKEKLGTVEAKKAVAQAIEENMPKWFFANEKAAKGLVGKMKDAQTSREAALKARKEAKAARKAGSGSGGKLMTSSKLKAASSAKPEEKELYITEGDSASKIGRDPRTQAVFPIRGKILNAVNNDLGKVLNNVEISTIASVIGAGIGPAFQVDEMDYHKIIIAADADSDGGHIRTLLIGLFHKYFPGLIESGRLYWVKPPLYKATRYVKGKPETRMFYSDEEMAANQDAVKGWEISRFKGLGEMGLDEAHEAIGDKRTRHLVRINMDDAAEAAHLIKVLLGKDAALRREWISDNVDFEIDNEVELEGAGKSKKPAPIPTDCDLTEVVGESMAVYSKDVILNRAIPDARDGFKPVQRYTLWEMHRSKLTPTSKHMKTATLAGRVLAFHPHGDASVKGAIDNMSQDWVFNTPMVDIHGNNGSIDGSPAAAGRYTESRQAPAAALVLERVDRGAVRLMDNYDNTALVPEVLPSPYPVLLANGAFGIAEGIQTSILPHNPVELLDGAIKLVGNPNMRAATLAGIIPGPDFPTGGELVNPQEANLSEIESGTAKYVLRGKARISMGTSKEAPCIEVTEIPWNPWGLSGQAVLTTESLLESMDKVLEPIRNLGITRVWDDSDEVKGRLSLKVQFRKNAERKTLEKVLQHLYAKSLLQVNLSCQDMMISGYKPVVMGVKDYLLGFVDFRLETLRNMWRYDVAQLDDAIEITDANIVAMSDPDGLMKITRSSKGKANMVAKLVAKYKITERQAEHIASMPLYRFNDAANLLKQYRDELARQKAERDRLAGLLADEEAAKKELVADLRRTRDELRKLGFERRTEIVEVSEAARKKAIEVDAAELVPDKPMYVVADAGQLFFKIGEQAYRNQSAAGKQAASVVGADLGSTRGLAVAFADNGQTVIARVNDLESGNLDAKGEPLSRTLPKLDPGASFVGVAACGTKEDADKRVVMVTEKGYVKVMQAELLAKDAERAKRRPMVSKAHSLKAAGDKVREVRVFTVAEMESGKMTAKVSWVDRNGSLHRAVREVAMSDLLKHSDGLTGSGRRSIDAKTGSIKNLAFSLGGAPASDASELTLF